MGSFFATIFVSLLRGGVVAAACPHPESLLIVGDNFDGSVMAVMLEIRGLVGNGVLAAEFVLNLGEGVGHIANLEREERASSGSVGNTLKNLVAGALGPADICGNRIDDGFGPLRHFDVLFARHVALVIFAVAEQNDSAPHWRVLRSLQQLVSARKINRVIKRGAA